MRIRSRDVNADLMPYRIVQPSPSAALREGRRSSSSYTGLYWACAACCTAFESLPHSIEVFFPFAFERGNAALAAGREIS
jgi:hypothetical protein